MNSTIKKILKPVASLYITVPVIALAILLIFFGTLAQRIMGIQDVLKQYFHVWIAQIDLSIFFPGIVQNAGARGSFPFPGGWTIIIALLINVVAAHTSRFKLTWKRSGIILIHFSLILLLAGEIIYANLATESQISLRNGQSSQWAHDLRHIELAVTDPSSPDHDQVTVISDRLLNPGSVINDSSLPFQITVDDYFQNSGLLGPKQLATSGQKPIATAGTNRILSVERRRAASGIKGESDIASVYVTLRAGSQELGKFLVTQYAMFMPDAVKAQEVEFNGKKYLLDLRYVRHYKPYTVTLLKFSHDRYLGTNEARNFSSRIRLVDPTRHVDREVLIWMNHPLRYAGETFYQHSFAQDDQSTVLEVTENPGLPLPYLACLIGAIGLLVHFGIVLWGFLRKRAKVPQAKVWNRNAPVGGFGQRFALPLAAVAVSAVFVGSMVFRAATATAKPYELEAFGKLPIVSDGRPLPFDSLARNTLRILSGKETLKRGEERIPAIQWLLEGLVRSPSFEKDQFLRIDNPDVLSVLHLDAEQKYYSMDDLQPHFAELQHQAEMAGAVEPEERDTFQRQITQLASQFQLFSSVFQGFLGGKLYIIPPAHAGDAWLTLQDVVNQKQKTGEVDPAAQMLLQIIDDYQSKQPAAFNADVARYDKYLEQNNAKLLTQTHFESFFNAADPFYLCIILYVVILLIVFASWLGFTNTLSRTGFALLIFTLIVQTFGLMGRIWIQGRPPVTNLYSSAIFVGWGVGLLCLGLEWVYRNGIPTVAAAVVGFTTLIVALYLSTDATLQPNGDTMAVLQAVLDTNLWLATHVVCVAMGYAATLLAGLLGIIYIVRGLLTPTLDQDLRRDLARMIYGIVCFGMLFSFVGTILGGIWADQSWGRFWGWDPKENGAILVVLWNALILHARWSGMVRERGVAVLAVFGNIVTAWSWIGTNMLGIGLHSYGFMDHAVPWLVGFVFLQLAFIATGMLPLKLWRSMATPTQPAGARLQVATVSN